jgi:hypothetical protein
MVVISSLYIWHYILHVHNSVHGYLPQRPHTSLRGKWEPTQTPTFLNTKHHSLVEIIKKALALKLQTRDKINSVESLVNLDFIRHAILCKACHRGTGTF